MADYNGVNATLYRASPRANVMPTDFAGRMRVAFDRFDAEDQNLATADNVLIGGSFIPKGARVVGGYEHHEDLGTSVDYKIIIADWNGGAVGGTERLVLTATGTGNVVDVSSSGGSFIIPRGATGVASSTASLPDDALIIVEVTTGTLIGAVAGAGFAISIFYVLD